MSKLPYSGSQFIQLETRDPIWEWHIPSDKLYLSAGAIKLLQFEGNLPRSMKEFLSHCPLEGLVPYLESVEKILNGSQGPFLELIYMLGKFMVRAQMTVLQRDIFGRGTIAVGALAAIDRQRIEPTLTPVLNSRSLINPPPQAPTRAVCCWRSTLPVTASGIGTPLTARYITARAIFP